MTPERWQHVKDVLAAALDRDGDERAAHLDVACGEDELLRAQVESLLLHHEEASRAEFLRTSDQHAKPRGEGQLGKELASHELIEEIGRGGMGVVYKARHRKLDRIVALKIVGSGQFASDEELARFQTEAEAAASLDHPHIVPVYEVGELESGHFLSMGYVNGASLAERLTEGPMPQRAASQLVKSVAEAVAFANDGGIIHRDLKPSNILLTQSDEPRVADFGLAKRLDADSGQTQTGTVLGTPSYMSPEQAEGRVKEVDPTTDVYALGAVLYETVTGRPPFQGASVMETLDQVRHDDPVSPRTLQPKLARDLETICLKCLRKLPASRYQSAHELADDLDCYLGGVPIKARPVSPLERMQKWTRRNPALATLGSALIVVLVTAVAVLSVAVARISAAERKAQSNFEWAHGAVEETVVKLRVQGHTRDDVDIRVFQEELLLTILDFYENLARRNSDDLSFEAGRARTYWWLAEVRSGMDSRAKKEQALADAQQMEAVATDLVEAVPDNADYQFLLGWSHGWQAILLRDFDRASEAEAASTKAIAVLEQAVADYPEHVGCSVKLGACYSHLGVLAADKREWEVAFEWHQKATEKLTQEFPADQAVVERRSYFLQRAYDGMRDAASHLQRWDDLVRLLAIRFDASKPHQWYDLALAQLAAGDIEAYKQSCAQIMERFETTPDAAGRIVYTCVPSSSSGVDMNGLLKLARQASAPGNWEGNVRLLTAVSYRMGDYEAAIRSFEATPDYALRAWDWLFAAMAYYQAEDKDKAVECQATAIEWIDGNTIDGELNVGWTELIEIESLREEAESLLSGTERK